uniref:uncharacterized protein LOC122608028 n=1 Tax=Erigeron canadensis TaxID=72917 RepID=UPI001CB89AF7|nr:uncharacterized protein LOC122608028 [Erigeron canadensis]
MPKKKQRLDKSERESEESEWEYMDEWESDEWKSVTLVAHNGMENRSRKGVLYTFKANRICVSESNFISNMFLKAVRVHHTHIEDDILRVVVDFCHYRASLKLFHTEEHAKDHLEKFDSDFLENHCKTDARLAKFLRAACELGIKSLLDLTSTAIVNNMVGGGKGTRDALKMFHLEGYLLTNNEMNEEQDSKAWAFM